jgi:hypothetical protein
MRGSNGHRATDGAAEESAPSSRGAGDAPDTEDVIRRDARLSPAQREALLGVYRSFTAGGSTG